MRKLTILFALLTLSVGMWAQNIGDKFTDANDLKYEVTAVGDNNTVKVINNICSNTYTIPATISYSNTIFTITEIGERAFVGCMSLQSITLPASVTTIGESAFSGCLNLQSITLPEGVTMIGETAFYKCNSLTDVTVAWMEADEIPTINVNVFELIANEQGPSGATLHIPAGTTELYQNKDVWKEFTIDDPNPLINIKAAAIAAINEAITGVTDETILAIANKAKEDITAATTKNEIDSIKTLALTKIEALYQILIARQGIQNAEINSMINTAVNTISNATQMEQITNARIDAMSTIGFVQIGRAEAKEELLGNMAEPCTDCTAVKVSDGETTITLYNATSVDYIVK